MLQITMSGYEFIHVNRYHDVDYSYHCDIVCRQFMTEMDNFTKIMFFFSQMTT